MALKQFSVVTRTYEALPRSKRLRGRGVNGSESRGGGSTVTVIGDGDGDGHTHANKTTLDAQSMDAEGYLLLKYKPDGSDDSKEEKVKAGYADEAAHAKEADNADKWDGRQFADYLDQPVKKSSNVQFKTLTTDQIQTSDFLGAGMSGRGFGVTRDANGSTVLSTDILEVRKKAEFYELVINQTSFELGETVKSLAGCEITSVEEVADDNVYRCYYDNKRGSRHSGFKAGDQARCQRYDDNFRGIIKYYWRVVKSVGDNYVDLYIDGQDENGVALVDGDGIPAEGDNIVQFGNRTDATRQTAIVISSTPTPTILQYVGINSFELPDPVTKISPDDNVFTGKVHIGAGSTGVGNLEGLPEEVQKAVSGEIGNYNLIRNSGFEGDYTTAELGGDTPLDADSDMFSPRLKYWTTSGDVKVVANDASKSGYAVELTNGSIKQVLDDVLIANEKYILSFKAKGTVESTEDGTKEGTKVKVSRFCNGVTIIETFELNNEFKTYDYLFEGKAGKTTITFEGNGIGNATICELQLERGSIRTSWTTSYLDNSKELAEMQAFKYISNAIREESTDILGGLILSNMIMLGNYVNGTMKNVTAGVSGTYADDQSVAFWGGGTYEQAINTVVKMMSMSEKKEWAENMANFVVTHGGDIFLRGYINALGGIFKGAVEIAGGKILLNADGSGALANGKYSWNEKGITKVSYPNMIEWVNFSQIVDGTDISLDNGGYIDNVVSIGDSVDDSITYEMPSEVEMGLSICLRPIQEITRSRPVYPAILHSTIPLVAYTEDGNSISGNYLYINKPPLSKHTINMTYNGAHWRVETSGSIGNTEGGDNTKNITIWH